MFTLLRGAGYLLRGKTFLLRYEASNLLLREWKVCTIYLLASEKYLKLTLITPKTCLKYHLWAWNTVLWGHLLLKTMREPLPSNSFPRTRGPFGAIRQQVAFFVYPTGKRSGGFICTLTLMMEQFVCWSSCNLLFTRTVLWKCCANTTLRGENAAMSHQTT